MDNTPYQIPPLYSVIAEYERNSSHFQCIGRVSNEDRQCRKCIAKKYHVLNKLQDSSLQFDLQSLMEIADNWLCHHHESQKDQIGKGWEESSPEIQSRHEVFHQPSRKYQSISEALFARPPRTYAGYVYVFTRTSAKGHFNIGSAKYVKQAQSQWEKCGYPIIMVHTELCLIVERYVYALLREYRRTESCGKHTNLKRGHTEWFETSKEDIERAITVVIKAIKKGMQDHKSASLSRPWKQYSKIHKLERSANISQFEEWVDVFDDFVSASQSASPPATPDGPPKEPVPSTPTRSAFDLLASPSPVRTMSPDRSPLPAKVFTGRRKTTYDSPATSVESTPTKRPSETHKSNTAFLEEYDNDHLSISSSRSAPTMKSAPIIDDPKSSCREIILRSAVDEPSGVVPIGAQEVAEASAKSSLRTDIETVSQYSYQLLCFAAYQQPTFSHQIRSQRMIANVE
ncbi:MAG: hypothetical protein M1814_001038 [Vezdaea aestivalis]|nr:MAG: hypothetical protein M1814_001038 [Vezdaea aestivalis]